MLLKTATLLTVALMSLKISKVVNWSWWTIMSPVTVTFVIVLIFLIFFGKGPDL